MKNREKGNISGFSNYYISRRGKLYSKFTGNWKLVKPVMKNTGYLSNSLVGDDGKRRNLYRHRLVALIYLPNPNNYSQVCHKDNNPKNNKPENLYWGTQSHNMQQMVRDGRQRKSKIVKYKSQVLSLHHQGFSTQEIIDSLGISKTSIRRIITNKI